MSFWTAFVALNVIIDCIRYPFRDHVDMYILRLAIGLIFWEILLVMYPGGLTFEILVIYPAFLAFWFWWLFDTAMGLIIARNPFYVGSTSRLDKIQRRYNLALVWLVKFGLAIAPFSWLVNKAFE